MTQNPNGGHDWSIDDKAIIGHYQKALPALRELGVIEDEGESFDALLVPGENESGARPWYKDLPAPEESDHDGRARPYFARADADVIPEEVAGWDYPTVYSTINYQPLSDDDSKPFTREGDYGHDWVEDDPLPGHGGIQRMALFADVDFSADVKTRPVDDETRALVEDALSEWVEEYANAAGTRDAVALLDSVGGTYVMLRPWATVRVFEWAHEQLDADDRKWFISKFADGWRSFNTGVQDHVSESVPSLDGVFELDGNTNKNRLFKAPLSIHKTLPGVVTPIDAEQPRFEFCHIDDVDEAEIERTREWCADFTAIPGDDELLEATAASIVATLWPDVIEEHDGDSDDWREALDAWVSDRMSTRKERERRLEEARKQREKRLANVDDSALSTATSVTPERAGVLDAIDHLDPERVAGDTIVGEWNDDANTSDGARAFSPTWGDGSCNGTANVVNDQGWTDTGDGGSGGPVVMALIDMDKMSPEIASRERATGELWGRGVDHLRKLGYEIPVWIPGRGSGKSPESDETYDRTPLWALRRAALVLDVVPDEDVFVEKEGDDGGTYLDFPGEKTRKQALSALDAAGIDHGWDTTSSAPHYPSEGGDNLSGRWDRVRRMYDEEGKGAGRHTAADALEAQTSWMYMLESECLWIYDHESGCYDKWGEQYAGKILERQLVTRYADREKNEIVGRLEVRNQTRRSELNANAQDGYHLCVGNGVVNLETGELQPHSPDFKFTRGVEWDYDPDRADTETILEFLGDITRREEDRDTLLDHLAHGMMPGHPFRAFVMMYGPGGNGKTQVEELFCQFVGDENAAGVDLPALTGDDDFATGALPGAFVNVGDDNSISEIRDASLLKSLTGGGRVRANEKHEKKFDFKNEAAMFFSANEPPRIAEESAAIGDRLYPIELPYEFKNDTEYDPDNPRHKKQVPNIAEKIASDAAAMRGLLVLCVEHAQRLLSSGGQYSMPEGPSTRREIYEAASDPIRRFALNHLESGDQGDVLLKDDAFDVYKVMCEMQDERVASSDGFKRQITQQSIIDVEGARTRAVTPGDGFDTCWRYVKFSSEAREIMPDRLISRYFEEEPGSAESDETDEDERSSEPAVFGAVPIARAAESLTGYATVTAKVATTKRLGEDENGVKAVLKDESGAIDAVAWESHADRLEAKEGEYIALKDAKVGEFDGDRQLQHIGDVTELESIQQGVGYTETSASDSQRLEAAADGGESSSSETEGDLYNDDLKGEVVDLRPKIVKFIRENQGAEGVHDSQIVDEFPDMNEDKVIDVIGDLCRKGRLTSPQEHYYRA